MPHILIVDDNILLLEILRLALEGEYTISTAQSGQEAMEIIGKQQIDLVITDHAMPGMTGLELIQKIENRQLNNKGGEPTAKGERANVVGAYCNTPLQGDIKIILYSACLHADLIAQALEAGATACLPKPFDLFELKNVIERVLRQYDER